MPVNTAMPIDLRALAPAPLGEHQRHHAEDEGERRHQDRPEARARRLDRRVEDGVPSRAQLARELDDQDGVLADSAISRMRPIWV